jgi:hypothetical protein
MGGLCNSAIAVRARGFLLISRVNGHQPPVGPSIDLGPTQRLRASLPRQSSQAVLCEAASPYKVREHEVNEEEFVALKSRARARKLTLSGVGPSRASGAEGRQRSANEVLLGGGSGPKYECCDYSFGKLNCRRKLIFHVASSLVQWRTVRILMCFCASRFRPVVPKHLRSARLARFRRLLARNGCWLHRRLPRLRLRLAPVPRPNRLQPAYPSPVSFDLLLADPRPAKRQRAK